MPFKSLNSMVCLYALTVVPTGSPMTTCRMLPGARRLNTTIGSPLSMQSEMAVTFEHLQVGNRLILRRGLVDHGVGRVDAVHLGAFQDGVGLDFHGAQRRGGVGGEVRVARAGGKDHHAPFFEVADGAAPDERLGDGAHLDGRDDTREHPGLLEPVLQGQAVDHGGEHAHVVGRGAVHPAGAGRQTPEDVAAADDDGGLHAELLDFFDVLGNPADHRGVNAVLLIAHEGFARKLEEDSLVDRGSVRAVG
jgi:hypothetical protein